MIISQICGGLGNQMFQYAMGRSFSLKHSTNLYLDIDFFIHTHSDILRNFELENFPEIKQPTKKWQYRNEADKKRLIRISFGKKLKAKILKNPAPPNKQHLIEPHYNYFKEIKDCSPPLYLQGYWQNEKYFIDYKEQIKTDFTFPLLPESAQTVKKEIQSFDNSIAIHVRRGDYINNPNTNKVHGICSNAYYKKAIKHINSQVSNAKLFIFSDEPNWVRDNFDTCDLPTTIVDLQFVDNAHHDMHLMSLCKHHIIANSSFSWWGAWLGEKGIVIAPKQWFVAEDMRDCSPVPDRWIKF